MNVSDLIGFDFQINCVRILFYEKRFVYFDVITDFFFFKYFYVIIINPRSNLKDCKYFKNKKRFLSKNSRTEYICLYM